MFGQGDEFSTALSNVASGCHNKEARVRRNNEAKIVHVMRCANDIAVIARNKGQLEDTVRSIRREAKGKERSQIRSTGGKPNN